MPPDSSSRLFELEDQLKLRVGSLEEKKSVNIPERIFILLIIIAIACASRHIIGEFKDETIVLYWSIVVCCVPVVWYVIECYYLSVRRRAGIAYFWYKREANDLRTSKWSRMHLIIKVMNADEELRKKQGWLREYDPEDTLSILEMWENWPEKETYYELIRTYNRLLKATEMEHITLRSMYSPIITCIFIAVEVIFIYWLIF